MFKEITLEAIGFFVWGVIATIGWIKKNIKTGKLKEERKILKSNIYDSKIMQIKEIYDLQRFSLLEKEIKKVLINTPMDRFTIIVVVNGTSNFDYLTVLFDQILGDTKTGGTSPYSKLKIDEVYQDIIKDLEKTDKVLWRDTSDKLGDIATFLSLEGITKTAWTFVDRIQLDTFNDMVMFCSMTTTHEKEITEKERKYTELILTGRIVPLVRKIISDKPLETQFE